MAKHGNHMLERARAHEGKAGGTLKTGSKTLIKTPDQSQKYSPFHKNNGK